MTNENTRAYLFLATAMTIVGSSVVVGKILTVQIPVFLAGCLSLFVASIVFLILLMRRGSLFTRVTKRDFFFLCLQAFFGTFLYRILLLYGLRFSGSAESGIITSTGPAVMGILAFLFLKERLSAKKLIGIGISVVGILVLQLFKPQETITLAAASIIGGALIFGSVIAENLFSILAKPLSKNVTPLMIASYVTFLSFLMFVPFAVYESLSFNFTGMTVSAWLAIGYYGIFVTVIAFFLWFKGLVRVDASTAGVFTSLIPVSSVLLSYIILHESFVWTHAVGGLCAIIGILFITKIEKKGSLASSTG